MSIAPNPDTPVKVIQGWAGTGATGDLAQRMLLPSLHGLERDGLLPEPLRISPVPHGR